MPPGHDVAPTPAFSPTDPPAPGRLAVIVSVNERASFFPRGLPLPRGVSVCDWPSDTPAGKLAAYLREFDPHALLTSWSSPPLLAGLVNDLPSLRYVCYTSGSVRHIVPRSFLERGGVVSNWGGLAAQTVAEHALLLTLAGLRRLPEWPPVIAGQRQWHPSAIRTQTLYAKRLVIHGFGHVARCLAGLMRPFGVRAKAFSLGVPAELFAEHGVHRCESLEELFTGAEVLVECEALTAHTRGAVTAELLARLAPEAVFVNVGRGLTVDEKALAAAAQTGRLRVALDVFSDDPIPPDSPLHAVPGAVLSPHIGGPTTDHLPACGDLALANLAAFFAGEIPAATLTPEMYDRMT